ncbi:MAG: hypothetical protein LBK72_09855, partial [Bifidobacteriaceae bacterium]|nr:hypothetical protein [Bifidobacteriaceae bacterium]
MTHPKNAMRKLRRAAVTTAVAAGLLATGLPALMTSASADDLLPYQDQSLPFSARAADLVSRLTMEEKAQQFFTGIFNATAGANSSSQAPAIPRLGIPSYNYWNEALHGVARRGNATEFPTGLGIASTWNRDLVYSFTEAASDEARDKTNDCLNSLDMTTADGLNRWCEGLTYWSPTINLNRDPRWGRADESYGEDPYIAGEIAGQFAQGLQGGRNQSLPDSVGGTPTSYLKAISTPKHYLANNSEVNRHSGTSNLSDRSLHEYYTAQFGKAAGAEYGAKSFMTSYNAINIDPNYTSKTWGPPTVATVVNDKGGTPVPANKYAVETIMRRLYGFDGFVTSDCGAVQDVWEQDPSGHSWNPTELGRQVTEAEGDAYSVKAGTDMDCTVSWTGSTYPKGLPAAQTQGLATEQDWDVALTRAFTIRFQTGEFDDADKVPYRGAEYTQNGTQEEAVGSPQHSAIAHQMSLESPVLLKNTGNALPLSVTSGGNTVVLGYYATHPIHGGYSPSQPPIVTQTAASQIAAYVGAQGGTTTVIDNAIVPAVGVKPSVARLEAWASGSTPPATGNET